MQELAVLRELQDLRVLAAVAADPDVALVVDRDAVVRLRPLVALARPAPVADEVARGIELEDRRRLRAARRGRRILVRGGFVGVDASRRDGRSRRDPARRRRRRSSAEDPVVRQRLRPERIDFEPRRLTARCACASARSSALPSMPSTASAASSRATTIDAGTSRPTRHHASLTPLDILTNFCTRLPS